MLFAIFFIFLVKDISGFICPKSLANECRCFTSKYTDWNLGAKLNIVECIKTKRSLELFAHMPNDTQVALVTGNNFPVLDLNWIENLQKLEVIDLTNNNIRAITGKIHPHSNNVGRLILNDNMIDVRRNFKLNFFRGFRHLRELHLNRAFKMDSPIENILTLKKMFDSIDLRNVYRLFLEENGFTNIPPRAFRNLPRLDQLYLRGNYLSDLSVLHNLTSPHWVDLSSNNIRFLTTENISNMRKFLSRPGSLRMVKLSNNPLAVDCTIQWAKDQEFHFEKATPWTCWENTTTETSQPVEEIGIIGGLLLLGILFIVIFTLRSEIIRVLRQGTSYETDTELTEMSTGSRDILLH